MRCALQLRKIASFFAIGKIVKYRSSFRQPRHFLLRPTSGRQPAIAVAVDDFDSPPSAALPRLPAILMLDIIAMRHSSRDTGAADRPGRAPPALRRRRASSTSTHGCARAAARCSLHGGSGGAMRMPDARAACCCAFSHISDGKPGRRRRATTTRRKAGDYSRASFADLLATLTSFSRLARFS